jgi:prephenate dehydrogenase
MRVFNALGLRTIFMEPEEHDKHVAYVSHLSHVSSFLLGQTVLDIEKDEKNIFALAGSGFASTVRLAKSSPEMWAPIFEQNLEYLSQALLEYIMHLQRFHYYLMKRDIKELNRIMSSANEIRRVLDGIELKTKSQQSETHIIEPNNNGSTKN